MDKLHKVRHALDINQKLLESQKRDLLERRVEKKLMEEVSQKCSHWPLRDLQTQLQNAEREQKKKYDKLEKVRVDLEKARVEYEEALDHAAEIGETIKFCRKNSRHHTNWLWPSHRLHDAHSKLSQWRNDRMQGQVERQEEHWNKTHKAQWEKKKREEAEEEAEAAAADLRLAQSVRF